MTSTFTDASRSPCPRTSSRPFADRDQLERGFVRLDPEMRAVIVLHHYLDLPLPAVAETLGIPLGTAKSRLHRALGLLRAALDADARPAPASRKEVRHERTTSTSAGAFPRGSTRRPHTACPRTSPRSSCRRPATRQRPWWSSLERWLPDVHRDRRARLAAPLPMFCSRCSRCCLAAIVGAAFLVGPCSPACPLSDSPPTAGSSWPTARRSCPAPDGTDRRELLRTTAGAPGMSISHDGSKVAFVLPAISPKIRVVTIADGTFIDIPIAGATMLAEEAVGWSADGRSIVFAGLDGDHEELFLAAADGSSVTTPIQGLLKPGEGVYQPAFSPDSRWIAFASEDHRTEFTSLYVVHPDGARAARPRGGVSGDRRRRRSTVGARGGRPQWTACVADRH